MTRSHGDSRRKEREFLLKIGPAIDHALNRKTAQTMMDRANFEQGAEAILNLAVSPALAGRSGLYFNGLREARAHAQVDDTEARRRLRRLSL
jgi:hypothetical protein